MLTEALGIFFYENSVVEYFIYLLLKVRIERLDVKMKKRMLTQVAYNFGHQKPKVLVVQ